jgi:PEGA domain-containing protein
VRLLGVCCIGRQGSKCVAVVLSLCTATATIAPRPAFGEPPDEVEAIVKKGILLRRQGRDADALGEFKRAAALGDSPRIEAQIGMAEQALGSWQDANSHLGLALDHRDDAWIRKNRPILEDSLAAVRSHLSQVEVWGEPRDAVVELDDVAIGKLPSAVAWSSAGDVELKVSAPGYGAVRRPLTLTPASRTREHVQLRALPVVPKLAESLSEGAARGSTSGTLPAANLSQSNDDPANDDTASPPSDSASTPLYKEWWFWVGIGVLAAGAGVGAYFLTRSSSPQTTCTMPPCDQL